MRLPTATTTLVIVLNLFVAGTWARSLATVDQDDGTPNAPGVAALDGKLPFLHDAGIKSRQLDLLNKTASLRHWDPPTAGCAALLAGHPVGAPDTVPNSVTLPNGDITLYNPWTTWTCMNVRRLVGGVGKERGRGVRFLVFLFCVSPHPLRSHPTPPNNRASKFAPC